MIKDFSQTILTLHGEPFKDGEKDLTYATVAENALATFDKENYKCYKVALLIVNNPSSVELTIDEAHMIIDAVNEMRTTNIIKGRVVDFING